MANAQITIDTTGVPQVSAALAGYPWRVGVAMVRALNRAIASGRTVMVREISRDIGLRSRDVRDALPIREASLNHPSATLASSLKRIPLIKFNARGPEPSRGRGQGVTYRLQGSRGRLPSAFIATMPTGHRGVFARVGRRRLAIVERFGPSLGHVFAKYRPLGLARAQEAFKTNFTHEFAFATTELASTSTGSAGAGSN